jgi:predicted peptidase
MLFVLPMDAAAQPGNSPVLAPGLHEARLVRRDGPAVNYAIFIPRGYSRATPVPLVLSLHFGVGGAGAAGAGASVLQILVAPGLADLGAIIVSPDTLGGNWSTPENEKAVTALLDMVEANYAIDTKKVAVTGYSMGGTGAWTFAAKFPDRFSAAIPIASRPPASAAGWRLPVLAIHSQDDQVAPFQPAAARIAELQKMGVNAKLIALRGITHYETDRFQGALHDAIPWLRQVWK